MVKLSTQQIDSFQSMIFSWWKQHRRDLPWRHTRDPYHILVSELMLQQTQVLRVIPKYLEFTTRFPTVFELAEASTAEVLRLWKGMGYNRRALYLKKMAEIVVQQYHGMFPKQEKVLLPLPGLGKYTARAVMVFAFELDVAMVDTNIRQIITHFFFNDLPQAEKEIEAIADQLVPQGNSWAWHQALMDYGSIVIARSPRRSNPVWRKSSVPFKQTNRFYRGRVMDALRENEYQEAVLLKQFGQTYQKDSEFLKSILKGLAKDGLIQRSKTGIISLPE